MKWILSLQNIYISIIWVRNFGQLKKESVYEVNCQNRKRQTPNIMIFESVLNDHLLFDQNTKIKPHCTTLGLDKILFYELQEVKMPSQNA